MRARVWFPVRIAPALALGVALLWPGVARAEDAGAAAAGAGGEAAARYERGVKAFKEERWREAVELFKQADQLAPSALLSLNIAKVYERMRDSRSALAWYRDFLRRSADASEQAPVRKRVSELEALLRAQGVQQLSVLSTPPGATVMIDSSSRGVTPWTGELAPGRHQLELTRRGYSDAQQSFELPADRAIDLTVTLLPSPSAAAPPPGAADAPAAAAHPEGGADGAARAVPLSAPAIPEMEAPVSVPRWWTWGLFGASGALLLGSGAVELSRRGLEQDGQDTQVQIYRKQAYDDVQSRRDLARALLGLGAVFGIAGGVSLFFDLRHAEAPAGGLALGCEPGACALRASQTW